MIERGRGAIIGFGLVCLTLLCACSLGFTLVRGGLIEPPELTLALGPLAISAARTLDTGCPEPWSRCDQNPFDIEGRAYYAIWLVVRTGPDAHHYRHMSLHLPLRGHISRQ
jgi:hypothetical protein